MLSGEDLRLKANARIDDRVYLIEELDLTSSEPISDEQLILHAYQTWGEDCVNYLIGDFAFAIWDERKQQFFCARDHFGVKPFFYTHIDGNFKFSSSLNELRRDPQVSNTLNEIAIGDYLLFGVNQDNATTIFKDIHRLPPGHSLTVANNEIKIRKYWTLPDWTVCFSNDASYVECFSEILSLAVKDRLRTDRVAISMSGGLDSTSLAAIARGHAQVAAVTVVYDNLIPDEERHYSDLAAKHLGIPITHVTADGYALFDGDMNQAEPFLLSPLTGQFNELLRLCAEFSTVALTGYDGDAFMHEPQPPRFQIRTRIKRMLRKPDSIPEWIDESFATRTCLRERWREFWSKNGYQGERPAAMRALNAKIWTALFEGYDQSATKLNLEVCHPFLDKRLIDYLLSIPTRPWCVNKHILRCAMSDKLPPAVLNRPKTGLAGDPALQLVRRASVRWLDSFEVNPQLKAFVDLTRRRPVADEKTPDALWSSLRVFALNYWLTNSQPLEMMHGT